MRDDVLVVGEGLLCASVMWGGIKCDQIPSP